MSPEHYQIDFQPIGRRIQAAAGVDLLSAAQQAGVELNAICGGIGVCEGCRVRLASGVLSAPTLEEEADLSPAELKAGYRLACQSIPLSDVKIEIPAGSLAAPQRLQVEGQEEAVELDPPVRALNLSLQPPSLQDLRADDQRLADALARALDRPRPAQDASSARHCEEGASRTRVPTRKQSRVADEQREVACGSEAGAGGGGQKPLAMTDAINPEAGGFLPRPVASLNLWRELPTRLREQNWQACLVVRGQGQAAEIVAVLPPSARLFGLAVDIGSTKLAAYLVDLESGQTVARAGAMNPQISYGEDVVSRIAYANGGRQQAETLRRRLADALNGLLAGLRAQARIDQEQVVEGVLVGNTAMHHLFLGLPVRQLGEAPYAPAVASAVDFPARDVGLDLAAGAHIWMPPNVAGFVGADHVAMVLATGIAAQSQPVLALDIGTNTEITLAAGGRLWSCSTASGPVFEGAHIRDGMRAAPGAIERVRWLPGRLVYETIDDQPAVGICGSGILAGVAALLSAGAVETTGRLKRDHPLVDQEDGEVGVTLVRPEDSAHGRAVRITRKDIHEVQLAKGAIRAGSELLLREAGLRSEDLDKIVIAGAFGAYIDIPGAVQVGIFPRLPGERFRQVGNSAGVGARQMLVSVQRRVQAQEIARRIEYVELTTHPEFTTEFVEQMIFQEEKR